MRLRLAGTRRSDDVIDLRDCDRDVDPRTVAAAIRDPDDDRLRCSDPGPAHRHVGCITADTDLDRRAALVAVARSLGLTAPQDDELRAVHDELATVEADTTDLTAARRRVAETADEQERLRERVATLRGRVQARREAGLEAESAAEALAAAARELSEVETERAAAEQALERAREAARSTYDVRDRRLRLQDRRDNLRRAARSHLVGAVRPDVRDALADLPGCTTNCDTAADVDDEAESVNAAKSADLDESADLADPADVTDRAFAMAAARIADLGAPVVVAWGPFEPRAAADWLDAPVVVL